MTDWRRKAAEDIFRDHFSQRNKSLKEKTLKEITERISQAEPERKGLEECAESCIKDLLEEIYSRGYSSSDTHEFFTHPRRFPEILKKTIFAHFRTLAPECHIEAAVEEIFNEYIDEKDPAPEQISSVKTSIADILNKHLREPKPEPVGEVGFEKELESLINKHSKENESDTPDFILAEYISKCLSALNWTVHKREAWYGRKTEAPDPTPDE